MKELIRNSIILFIITLVAGLFLGFIYEVTKEPRAYQEEKARQEAYKNVFSEAETFEDFDIDYDKVAKYLEEKEITSTVAIIDGVVLAKDSAGSDIGYVITVTSKEGYAGDIKFTVGITNEGKVNGLSILRISETPGLGMKAAQDSFLNQYADKTVDLFVYSKTGAKADNEIDAISGATITTNAMTNGVNACLYCFDFIVGGDSVE